MLSVRDANVRLGGHAALDGVDLDVPPGKTIGLTTNLVTTPAQAALADPGQLLPVHSGLNGRWLAAL
jgi:hypothetical protein